MHRKSFAIAIFITIALAFVYGIGIGIFSLREPDTCFLLSMGRWICQHKTLPEVDPFSYTYAMFPNPHGLVIYQWLTEVIFYGIVTISGAIGLVVFVCIVLVYSLVVIPWRILEYFKLGPLRIGIITAVLALGSIERMLLRPEIFSYLFLALYLEAMVKEEIKIKSPNLNWRLVALLATMMILWANLHSGFVIGILLLAALSLRDLILALYFKLHRHSDDYPLLSTWSISFMFCLLASLITPYGIRLWQYIPHLYFQPINQYIGELQPLTISLVVHNLPLLLSFGSLSVLVLFQIIRSFRKKINRADFIYLFIAIAGLVLGLFIQRLITFGLLLMLPLVGSAFHVKRDPAMAMRPKILRIAIMIAAIAGSLSTILFSHPTIPVVSKAFVPPFVALDYIARNNLEGNLLNDPEFGDVLMWNSQKLPKLFVDSRFDIYPWRVLQDYLVMADCKNNWRELLTNYNINWVFLPPTTPLCRYLEKDSAWAVALKNEHAEIIVHKETAQSVN